MTGQRDGLERNARIGIPSIPAGAMPWYLTVFAAITVYLSVANILVAANTENFIGWMTVQYVVTSELIRAGAASLVVSPIIVETGRMVIAAIWSERRERKAREEGRAEGEESANRRWSEWNRRRREAEAKGVSFDEPEPGSRPTMQQ